MSIGSCDRADNVNDNVTVNGFCSMNLMKYQYLFDSLVGILYSCLSLVEVLVDLREIISSAVVYYKTIVL